MPLFQATEPNGFLRVLSVELKAPGDNGGLDVFLQEEFIDPAASHPGDVHTGYSPDVHLGGDPDRVGRPG